MLAKVYQDFLSGLAFLVAVGAHQLKVVVLPALDASYVDAVLPCSN